MEGNSGIPQPRCDHGAAQTAAEQQWTNLPSDFDIQDFDISPDGGEVVLERVQERSEVVLLDLLRR